MKGNVALYQIKRTGNLILVNAADNRAYYVQSTFKADAEAILSGTYTGTFYGTMQVISSVPKEFKKMYRLIGLYSDGMAVIARGKHYTGDYNS